jgi:uncharacterized membrane protein (DUF2068 family)
MKHTSMLLAWIIAFKALKAAMLTTLGVALLTTQRADQVDLVFKLALAIHVPLTSEVFDRMLTFATGLTVGRRVALAITAFGYAALMGTEGVALYLRRHWARWFTIIATGSLIPLEVYEIVREVHPIRILVLLANVGIVVYLVRRPVLFEDEKLPHMNPDRVA